MNTYTNKKKLLIAIRNSKRDSIINLLKHASEELKADREVVLTAVSYTGCTLKYASKQLQDDVEFIYEAMLKSKLVISYASPRIRAKVNEKLEELRILKIAELLLE